MTHAYIEYLSNRTMVQQKLYEATNALAMSNSPDATSANPFFACLPDTTVMISCIESPFALLLGLFRLAERNQWSAWRNAISDSESAQATPINVGMMEEENDFIHFTAKLNLHIILEQGLNQMCD